LGQGYDLTIIPFTEVSFHVRNRGRCPQFIRHWLDSKNYAKAESIAKIMASGLTSIMERETSQESVAEAITSLSKLEDVFQLPENPGPRCGRWLIVIKTCLDIAARMVYSGKAFTTDYDYVGFLGKYGICDLNMRIGKKGSGVELLLECHEYMFYHEPRFSEVTAKVWAVINPKSSWSSFVEKRHRPTVIWTADIPLNYFGI
jgi:hypothetical protein